MRPRTITVDVTRGGDYALADYRGQTARLTPASLRAAVEALREAAQGMLDARNALGDWARACSAQTRGNQ